MARNNAGGMTDENGMPIAALPAPSLYDAQGRARWGTAGAPAMPDADNGGAIGPDGMPAGGTSEYATIDGQRYSRGATWEQLNDIAKGMGLDWSGTQDPTTYSPEHGYLVPIEYITAITEEGKRQNPSSAFGDFFSAAKPLLMMAAAGIGASALFGPGGMFGAGAEAAGVAGAEAAGAYPASWNMLAGAAPEGGMAIGGAEAAASGGLEAFAGGALDYPAFAGADYMGAAGGAGLEGTSLSSLLDGLPNTPPAPPSGDGGGNQFDNSFNPDTDSPNIDPATGMPITKLPGGAAAAGSLLSKLINGGGNASDWAQLAGVLGASGLGMLGANKQADAYTAAQDKYLALGAPSRARLESSYQPGFSMANEPGFTNAMDTASKGILSGLSAKGGNPYDNPGAVAEGQNRLMGSFALPQLNTYRSQNASSGQLGVNTAGTMGGQAAGQAGGMYDAAGYGLAQLTAPPNPYADLMKNFTLGGWGK